MPDYKDFRVPNPITLMRLLNDPVKFKVACCILDWLPKEDWTSAKWVTKHVTNKQLTLKYGFPPRTVAKAVKTMESKDICKVDRSYPRQGYRYDFSPLMKMPKEKFFMPVDSPVLTASQQCLMANGNFIKFALLKNRAPNITPWQLAQYGHMTQKSAQIIVESFKETSEEHMGTKSFKDDDGDDKIEEQVADHTLVEYMIKSCKEMGGISGLKNILKKYKEEDKTWPLSKVQTNDIVRILKEFDAKKIVEAQKLVDYDPPTAPKPSSDANYRKYWMGDDYDYAKQFGPKANSNTKRAAGTGDKTS